MINYGLHDSFGWQALTRLPGPDEERARQELAELLAPAKVMADAKLRCVRIDPSDLRSLVEQLTAEADRLFEIDDTIAPVFDAWSESYRLAYRV